MTDESAKPEADTSAESRYATSDSFEIVLHSVRMAIRAWGLSHGAEMLSFPPIINLPDLYKSGYIASFPNLVGAIHCLDHVSTTDPRFSMHEFTLPEWSSACGCTEFAMTPAACYPIYPIAAATGALPQAGKHYGAFSYCFRREPSQESARLQAFRMQELIYLGEQSQVLDFRREAIAFAEELARSCGLEPLVKVAHDPFFGRAAKLIADIQIKNEEKFEMIFDLGPGQEEVACMSFNYHAARFGEVYAIKQSCGLAAHSTCFAVGLERYVMALLRRHGFDLEQWPVGVKQRLGIGC